jgi:hypothetical protein
MGSTISNINDMIENSKDEYLKLLDSGMMWEFHPWVTGNWDKDKDKFIQTKFEEKTKTQRIMDDGQGDEHLLDKHEKQIEENYNKLVFQETINQSYDGEKDTMIILDEAGMWGVLLPTGSRCYICGKLKDDCKCLDEHLAKKCSITEAVIEDMKKKSEVGFKKYGVTLDRKDLSLRDWLEHSYSEVLDMAKYLKKAITELDETNETTKSI